ncbi:metal-sensitive transcriptional regulator [Bifidobacterium apis]|uniref:metal-sensitive transcriptional regulator n=1 Tax=Bifidobacterium apis TaxID=3081440 RepID=UPI0030DD53DF
MPGYANDKKRTITRLRRVEGQVRAIEQMVESDIYCIDILTQIAASTSALKSVALTLLDDHMNHCVREAAEKGGEEADEKMQEASDAIARLVRS